VKSAEISPGAIQEISLSSKNIAEKDGREMRKAVLVFKEKWKKVFGVLLGIAGIVHSEYESCSGGGGWICQKLLEFFIDTYLFFTPSS
jgi:hypothetical protein